MCVHTSIHCYHPIIGHTHIRFHTVVERVAITRGSSVLHSNFLYCDCATVTLCLCVYAAIQHENTPQSVTPTALPAELSSRVTRPGPGKTRIFFVEFSWARRVVYPTRSTIILRVRDIFVGGHRPVVTGGFSHVPSHR